MRTTTLIDSIPQILLKIHPPAEVPDNAASPSRRIKRIFAILLGRVNDDRSDELHLSGKGGVDGLNEKLILRRRPSIDCPWINIVYFFEHGKLQYRHEVPFEHGKLPVYLGRRILRKLQLTLLGTTFTTPP